MDSFASYCTPTDQFPPPPPAFYEKTWSCFAALPAQQILSCVRHALMDKPDTDVRVDMTKWRVWIHSPNLFMIVHVFRVDSNSSLIEFQRRTGDRSTFRAFAATIVSAIRRATPSLRFASTPSNLAACSMVPGIALTSDDDAFRKPVLDSPHLSGVDVSEPLLDELLQSASSPIHEVHREALRCLVVLSESNSGVESLRQSLPAVIPILCERLNSHDDEVASMTALIGTRIFSNDTVISNLSHTEHNSLLRALVANMEEHRLCVPAGVSDLYDVVKTLCKMSPTICT